MAKGLIGSMILSLSPKDYSFAGLQSQYQEDFKKQKTFEEHNDREVEIVSEEDRVQREIHNIIAIKPTLYSLTYT